MPRGTRFPENNKQNEEDFPGIKSKENMNMYLHLFRSYNSEKM